MSLTCSMGPRAEEGLSPMWRITAAAAAAAGPFPTRLLALTPTRRSPALWPRPWASAGPTNASSCLARSAGASTGTGAAQTSTTARQAALGRSVGGDHTHPPAIDKATVRLNGEPAGRCCSPWCRCGARPKNAPWCGARADPAACQPRQIICARSVLLCCAVLLRGFLRAFSPHGRRFLFVRRLSRHLSLLARPCADPLRRDPRPADGGAHREGPRGRRVGRRVPRLLGHALRGARVRRPHRGGRRGGGRAVPHEEVGALGSVGLPCAAGARRSGMRRLPVASAAVNNTGATSGSGIVARGGEAADFDSSDDGDILGGRPGGRLIRMASTAWAPAAC